MVRGFWSAITVAMRSWYQSKLFIEHAMTLSHDALHIIVGFAVWIAAALLGRRPVTSWMPWAWLLLLILWNEAVDLWIERWPDPGRQYSEGLKDLLLTMTLPTLIMLLARTRPGLFDRRDRKERG